MTKRNDIRTLSNSPLKGESMRLLGLIGLIMLLWALPQAMLAQDAPESPTEEADPDPQPIIVNGNVYGGGNKGRVDGNTTVTVVSGDLNKVFGGARMANVGGRSFVHIDGENTTEYIMANQVYGGNDISGTIGEGSVATTVPQELTAVMPTTLPAGKTEDDFPKKNKIDNTWKTFVRVSGDADEIVPATSTKSTKHAVYIGALFAGGNGEYVYEATGTNEANATKTYNVFQKSDNSTAIATITVPKNAQNKYVYLPEVPKTYMEINGGSIIYAFGGGNNATVTQATVINVDNPTKVVASIKDPNNPNPDKDSNNELLTNARVLKMGINPGLSHPNSDAFQIGSLFGGNNAAAMAIMPTWNLQSGLIRNVYSGGNRGDMISRNGILLTIDPAPMNTSSPYVFNENLNDYPLVIDNVYGGCRIADVRPQVWNNEEDKYDDVEQVYNLDGYHFPHNLAARTLVYGGDINNVYGGNDIRGKVYFGNALGIYSSIRGNVYGGGNGSYAYTDNVKLENDPTYGDLYYEVPSGKTSVQALNAIRPNSEQVSIRVAGKETKKTIIHGSIFVGGNSATLKRKETTDESYTPLIELKIGSYAIADNVFLGNNGEEMVAYNEIGKDNDGNEVQDALEGVLRTMVRTDKTSDQSKYSSLVLTNATTFAEYMEGAAMDMIPKIVFDDEQLNDPATYIPYSSQIGSLYLGGNVGSMTYAGKNTMQLNTPIYIYNKFVGGCNNADVPKTDYNAAYEGGILGSSSELASDGLFREGKLDDGAIKDRIELNFNGLRVRPQRWAMFHNNQTDKDEYLLNEYDQEYLEWNTVTWDNDLKDFTDVGLGYGDDGLDNVRRLNGGNIYGGCYNSGHVNGNVVIDINSDVHERDVLFAKTTTNESGETSIEAENRNTGVILDNQRDDLMAVALSVFGAGKGAGTEIWGSTTVNLIKGYAFQAYGGGEEGVVGKGTIVKDNEENIQYDTDGYIQKAYNDYNEAYSSTVNLSGTKVVYSSETAVKDLAESEYIYGGGNEGNVCGDTYVNLGNGRIYDVFGGASNADVYGRSQVIIGHNDGFPWVIDNVYGGNDFGGTIWAKGENKSFIDQVRKSGNTPLIYNTNLAESSTYVKYLQGHVDSIFGGSYGHYNYKNRIFSNYTNENGQPIDGFTFPHLEKNSFVHFVPNDNSNNKVGTILGGGTGWPGSNIINNGMQEESYVLIDDTKTTDESRFNKVDVYGGGAYAGAGTSTSGGTGRTIVDLYAGSINSVYGGCNQEGLVGYTLVNVPTESKIKLNSIFGGSKGYDAEKIAEKPELSARYCDNYVTIVDFKGANTIVNDAIYGGNRNCRVSCDTYINIEAPVMQSSGYQATIYGAGYGAETVSGRTNVFMNSGSVAYKVFGGGRDGNVFNFASLRKWLIAQYEASNIYDSDADIEAAVVSYGQLLGKCGTYFGTHIIPLPQNTGTYVNSTSGVYDGKCTLDIMPTTTNLLTTYYNTNVHLMQGSRVTGYAYGGGLGSDAVVGGTTYIELKGGIVDRDIYGGGQGGSVMDEYELAKETDFVATTNVYIEGGMARNVYGGGYMGHVGKHTDTSGKSAEVQDSYANDIPGEAKVVIGKLDGTSFMDGIPAITRNVYGAGEGGSVWGTTNVTINNGYVGYRTGYVAVANGPLTQGNVYYMDDYGAGKFEATGNETADETHKYYYLPTEAEYVEELLDNGNSIDLAGNVFGGGYVVNSYVDETYVKMYGGTLRGCLFGGGEVGPIGRGTVRYKDTYTTGLVNGDARIYKAGKTHVTLFDGHVKRNVFGGGRGKDSWGGDGTMYMKQNMTEEAFASLDLQCKGFVFGQTEVNIHGGEVGTDEGVVLGYGNVFGGGDVGCVYSAYMDANGKLAMGKKSGKRYNEGIAANDDGYDDEGYYYKWEKSGENYSFGTTKTLTEDCKVLVEPWLKANTAFSISDGSYSYTQDAGKFVSTDALNYLSNIDPKWTGLGHADVNKNGIIIHNAVFAGGNTPPGSTEVYANAPTVFGNATASINDVYHRDLITIGRGRVGGLYGDGNLTLVDGYRELNITNYGTDYYSITNDITKEQFDDLPKREQAYYEIRYKCTSTCQDKNDRTYTPGSTITADELLTKFVKILKDENDQNIGEESVKYNGIDVLKKEAQGWVPNDAEGANFWVENGVFSRYAGRPMNTIQRADFCGVFGSRMVMQGAQDRVPETVDYTNYTINRVREVSLNKKGSSITGDATPFHGNYFGIYNVVNFLGALTSDVDFQTTRTTESANTIHLADIDPNMVTITAANTDAAAAAKAITGITDENNDLTLEAANAKALYTLRSQGIQGVTIKPKSSISITVPSNTATEATAITGITATGTTDNVTTLEAASIDAYYQLDAAKIEGIHIDRIELTKQTFYDWKAIHHEEKTRNNGTCHNKVALASGVHLELTTEQSTGPGLYEKKWGLITGVVELDLINVQPGVGGGFVYAKNIHGVRESSGKTNTLLSDLNLTGGVSNAPAVTNKIWKYIETDKTASSTQEEWETSGNFVHSTQTIIDDCYNIGAKYKVGENENPVPAHYWFVKGSVYVYDQYISAYTGSPNAFSETVNIPLTITSASHGQMKLMDVMPNYYAYFANTNTTPKRKLEAEETIELRDKVYQLNDPITYWEYFMLNDEEKAMFVEKTYVTTDSCKIENDSYPSGYVTIPSGYVMLPDEYEAFMTAAEEKQIETNGPVVKAVKMMTKDKNGNDIVEKDKDGNDIYKPFSDIFRSSNNMSHASGYILTYKIDNPDQWNQWYTKETDKADKNRDGGTNYIAGPTYHPTTPGLYGQQDYKVGNIISQDVYKAYAGLDENNDGQISGNEQGLVQLHQTAIPTNDPTAEGYDPDKVQAEFEPAYIVTKDVVETGTLRLYKGATLGASSVTSELYTAGEDNNSVEPAYIVTSTIQLDKTKFIYRGTYMTKAEKDKFKTDYSSNSTLVSDIEASIVPAYYCKTAGKYGGNYYVESQNYYAKEAFSELSAEDRAKFAFNYDALDLLIDSTYSRTYAEGQKYQYDSADGNVAGANANAAHYSLPTSIDYEATYRGGGTLTCGNKEITDGVTITGKEYESLLNERYYYVPIDVKQTTIDNDQTKPYPYYVVRETMMLGDTPYAAGQVIDKETYDNLSSSAKQNITTLTFTTAGTYYYCREGYTIAAEPAEGEKGGCEVTDIVTNTPYTYGENVPVGTIISLGNFTNLTNNQANFVIHGTAPTETSTLFVTRNSDIKDLSQEKIITVVYEYNYVESDMSGMNIVPVSERHVLNIHINFKSGIPTIEDIKAPDIVLPGTSVSLQEPFVQPGAYEVTGGGWELFDDPANAVSHINGIEYTPNVDPLYLYQNNYWVSYYAKTYLGKTYSNAVQVSVANYHDLKKVMSALTNHYYIDHPDLYKDNNNIIKPKIYINDYSKDETGKKDGLDLFKDLYDLSVLNNPTTSNTTGLITTGDFEGHKPLNSNVSGGNHLEFILRTDIERGTETVANTDQTPGAPETITRIIPWTPIGTGSGTCFSGTLHGDGHTLSGLDNSLFDELCGDVYNLGVTGTFTGAGIAESGGGYIENSWISSTSTEDKTTQPVFGNPNRDANDARGPIQVVNSYYMEEDAVAGTDGSYAKQITDHNVSAHGTPIRKPAKAFYNGEVTYDLNGFYLYKRYNDHEKLSGSTYHYWLPGNDEPQEGAYASNPTWSSAGANNVMYVEDRFADGDFRYADGTIPESKDTHEYSYTVDDENSTENGKIKHEFYPIYPEDYIFFGQRLTYGYSDSKDHDPLPSAVSSDNHVYRAPAYFRNSEMGVAHFNPDAILAAKSKDGTREAYPGMTAIDFAGHNDIHDETNGADKPYLLGTTENGLFYPPLLDDDGLTSIMNADETRNLLVYAPAETSESEYANKMTYDILNGYFRDPKYTTYSDENTSADKKYDDGKKYGRVAIVPDNNIYGHVVQRDLKATNDHFLVDRQDFNAPFSYQFIPSTGSDEGTRMWYQREPDNYVEFAWSDDATPVRSSKGWEGVSIPFEAEVVTTDQKGEITHFYKKSADSGYERGYDSGHEYWLRQFTGVDGYTDANQTDLKATMVYPTAGKSDDTKEVKNKFLWDYYYEAVTGHKHKDNNDDTYQTYYEQETRQYANYPHLTNGTPYIIGLPGKSYYEFDLSGTFRPTTTASPTPAVLDAQTITFASMPGATIGVSDGEKAGVEHKGYTFKPSYLNEELTNGNYVLNGDGDAYTKLDNTGTGKYHTTGKTYADATAFAAAGTLYTDEEGTTVATEWANAETVYYTRGSEKTKNEINNVTPSLSAFRPYFTGTYNPSSNPAPRRIIFSGADDKLQKDLEERHSGDDDGGLIFSVDKRDIVVESTRRDNATVRITTTSGVVVSTFTIEPGQIVRTTVNMTGVYMGNRTKLIVK